MLPKHLMKRFARSPPEEDRRELNTLTRNRPIPSRARRGSLQTRPLPVLGPCCLRPASRPGPHPEQTGWMTETMDEYSLAFTSTPGTIADECLDIGLLMESPTLPAARQRARVLASRLEPRHLQLLAERVPVADRSRFRSQPGRLPDVDFPTQASGHSLRARPAFSARGRHRADCSQDA